MDTTTKVLRATAVSTLLALVYVAVFGAQLLAATRGEGWVAAHVRLSALLAVVLVFAVPTALAGAEQVLHRTGRLARWLGTLSTVDPTPTAWDYGFRAPDPLFVRVLTPDGRWIGGYFNASSYASSFPQPRELFVSVQYRMGEDGSFGEPVAGSAGAYVRCDDAVLVEFVRPGGAEGA